MKILNIINIPTQKDIFVKKLGWSFKGLGQYCSVKRKLSVEAAQVHKCTCAGEKLLSTLSDAPQPLSPSASMGKKPKFKTLAVLRSGLDNLGGNRTNSIKKEGADYIGVSNVIRNKVR